MQPMGKASRKAARRQARLERKAQEAQQFERQRRQRLGVYAGIAVVAVAAGGWALWSSLRPEQAAVATAVGSASGPSASTAAPRPQIIAVADQGRDHVAPGAHHPAYNSNPPTSGWHYGATAPWGFHNSALPDELIIHNLEHGGIWITYKDAEDTEVVDALVGLARGYRTKVIITHRPQNDSRIAVAAWGRLMKLDRFDRTAIVAFINRFKNKGPEFVPD